MKLKTSSLTRLLQLSREERPLLIKGMIFLGISSAALMAHPQYIKTIIDEAIKNKDSYALNMAAITALVVFVIQGITSSLRYYYFTLAVKKQ